MCLGVGLPFCNFANYILYTKQLCFYMNDNDNDNEITLFRHMK